MNATHSGLTEDPLRVISKSELLAQQPAPHLWCSPVECSPILPGPKKHGIVTHTFLVGTSLSNCPDYFGAFCLISSLLFPGTCEPCGCDLSFTICKICLWDYISQITLGTCIRVMARQNNEHCHLVGKESSAYSVTVPCVTYSIMAHCQLAQPVP